MRNSFHFECQCQCQWQTIYRTVSRLQNDTAKKSTEFIKGHRLNFSGYEKKNRATFYEFSHFILFGAPLVLPPHISFAFICKLLPKIKRNERVTRFEKRRKKTKHILIYHRTKSIPNEADWRMLHLCVMRLINKQFEFIVHIAYQTNPSVFVRVCKSTCCCRCCWCCCVRVFLFKRCHIFGSGNVI